MSTVIDMGRNLQERSLEIKMEIEKYLRELETPCTTKDIVTKVRASRYPVQNHLREMLASGNFPDIGMVHTGGYDIIYRKVPKPVVEAPAQP